jgi:hypothetical protein
MTLEEIVVSTNRRIWDAYPELPLWQVDQAGVPVLYFPIPPDSDYRYCAWFESCSRLSIEADPTSIMDLSKRLDFWHHPFKLEEFTSTEELVQAFQAELIMVLSHKTRITQYKRPGKYEFVCEALLDDWILVYQVQYDRHGFNVPRLSSRSHVYYASPTSDVRRP